MSHYAVFVSFSFVLDTMRARCKEVPWSVVQFRCTQLPKLTETVTSHHIITTCMVTLYYLLHFKFNVHLIATYVASFCLISFLSYLPTFLPHSLSSSFPALSLSPYSLLQTLHKPVSCIVFKSIPIAQEACYSIKVSARKDMRCHCAVLLCGKVRDSNCCRSNEL